MLKLLIQGEEVVEDLISYEWYSYVFTAELLSARNGT